MNDVALRAEIEKRVRARLQPGFDAQRARVEPTAEQKQARLESMPPVFREMIEQDGWPEPFVMSEEFHENMIQSETDEMLQIVMERRATNGKTGELDEDELTEAYVSRSDVGLGFMLKRLKGGKPHPIRQAMIDMMEQNNADLARLRNNPTEEDVAEISERLAVQFRDFDIEGTMQRWKDAADKNGEE